MIKNIFISLVLIALSSIASATVSSKVIVGAVVNNIFLQGNLIESNSAFDIAINGHGFLALKRTDNKILYTRFGKLGMDKDGDLQHIPSRLKVITTTSDGEQENISLKDYATRISATDKNKLAKITAMRINEDGQIEAAYSDGELIKVAQIKLVAFENVRNLKVINEKQYLLAATKSAGESAFLVPGEHPAGLIYDRYLESLSMKEYKKLLQ